MSSFFEARLEVIEALAWVATVAAGAVAAFIYARRARRRLSLTMAAASAIVAKGLSSADRESALRSVSSGLARLFEADAVALALPIGDGRLGCVGSFGYAHPEEAFLLPGEGISGHAYETGEAVVASDVGKEPRYKPEIPGMISALAIPMRYQGRIIGAFNLESGRRRYTEADLELINPLVDQIAAVVENARLTAEATQRAAAELKTRKELQAVSAVVLAGVASGHDLDVSLDSMVTEIADRLGWESMELVLFADDGLLYTRAYYGYPEYSLISFKPGHGIVGAVAQSGVGRLVPDVRSDPDYLDVVTETRSEMCVPLRVGERVLGVLNAESPRPGAFTQQDFELLGTLADQMAIVIERGRLAGLERDALERLRGLDKLKDDFVATVSHELRTPLTSINGYAQTMLARADVLEEADRRTFLEATVRQCNRLSIIVESLLLASQLESGKIQGDSQFVVIRDMIHEAAEAAEAEDRLVVDVPAGLGLIADSFRLHHIFRNLLENACKYSPTDAPVLVKARQTQDSIEIEVCDGGPGIPEGSKEVVFQRFRRLSDPVASGVPGTGLGLYIAQRFTRDLDAELSVGRSSEPGFPGARFVLQLPDLPAPG